MRHLWWWMVRMCGSAGGVAAAGAHSGPGGSGTAAAGRRRGCGMASPAGAPRPPVPPADEIDHDEFEASSFAFLGEAPVAVPGLGAFTAQRPPITVLTSGRGRDLHGAVRRRCLYHGIDFPPSERAAEILRRSVPAANEPLIRSATEFIGRRLDLDKAPGMAETIDRVAARSAAGATEPVRRVVVRTLSAIAETPADRATIPAALDEVTPRGKP